MAWALDEGLVKKNIIRSIEPPPAAEAVIQTFTKEEINWLLKSCDNTRTWKSRAEITSARSTGPRNKAIILTLLDTGVRASELCGIKYCDLNIGHRTAQAIWKSLLPRINTIRPEDPLFVSGFGDDWRSMSREHWRSIIYAMVGTCLHSRSFWGIPI